MSSKDDFEGKVLFMDDEESIRIMAGLLLRSMGLDVITAKDGDEALALYRESLGCGRPFDLAVLDVVIVGGKGGLAVAREMKRIDPGFRMIVSSGYCDDDILRNHRKYGFVNVLQKPYTIGELKEVLSHILEQQSESSPGALALHLPTNGAHTRSQHSGGRLMPHIEFYCEDNTKSESRLHC